MDFGSGFLFVAAIAVLTGYAAFQQFLRHQRRVNKLALITPSGRAIEPTRFELS